ncbi:hypothetical protein ACF068_31875 [Streptomyces sp. NPDC016309]|uniref:hypothetical protein n=1 Tax=Streptomyces sp. NPDC016309 TaxID=3364965 RepID=UPI003701CC90
MTTEHFTLQGARAATISESTSRATIFIGSVSAGMVALGLIDTATGIGTAFYALGLIFCPRCPSSEWSPSTGFSSRESKTSATPNGSLGCVPTTST